MSEENGRTDLTWRELLDEGGARLSEAGVPDAGTDAWYLMEAAFGIDRVHYYLDQNRPIHAERLEKGYGRYQEMLQKRAERIPLQQILGMQDFMGMTFSVDENVLIPRQDTETLVERVLRDYPEKDLKLLDMCTGSGCILLSIVKLAAELNGCKEVTGTGGIAISLAVLGGYQNVTAVDISEAALRVAKKNARRLFLIQKGTARSESFQVSEDPWCIRLKTWLAKGPRLQAEIEEHSLTLLQSNLFQAVEADVMYDVIVSNPPYIPSAVIDGLEPEVRDHEPRLALDGSEDGLYFYRVLALECSKHLNKGGCVYFEIGYDQAEAVSRILTIAGYREIEVIKDEPGLDRVVKARWNR